MITLTMIIIFQHIYSFYYEIFEWKYKFIYRIPCARWELQTRLTYCKISHMHFSLNECQIILFDTFTQNHCAHSWMRANRRVATFFSCFSFGRRFGMQVERQLQISKIFRHIAAMQMCRDVQSSAHIRRMKITSTENFVSFFTSLQFPLRSSSVGGVVSAWSARK